MIDSVPFTSQCIAWAPCSSKFTWPTCSGGRRFPCHRSDPFDLLLYTPRSLSLRLWCTQGALTSYLQARRQFVTLEMQGAVQSLTVDVGVRGGRMPLKAAPAEAGMPVKATPAAAAKPAAKPTAAKPAAPAAAKPAAPAAKPGAFSQPQSPIASHIPCSFSICFTVGWLVRIRLPHNDSLQPKSTSEVTTGVPRS